MMTQPWWIGKMQHLLGAITNWKIVKIYKEILDKANCLLLFITKFTFSIVKLAKKKGSFVPKTILDGSTLTKCHHFLQEACGFVYFQYINVLNIASFIYNFGQLKKLVNPLIWSKPPCYSMILPVYTGVSKKSILKYRCCIYCYLYSWRLAIKSISVSD